MEEPLQWCVVANVAAETSHGQRGQESRAGLKHFSPGTKVWLVAPYWGDGGERIAVLGKHRGSHRRPLVRMVVDRRHLTNFRVRGVYSPSIHRELGPNSWRSREEAEQAAEAWNAMTAAEAGVRYQTRRIDLLEALRDTARPRPSTTVNWDAPRRIRWLSTECFGDPPDPAATIGDVLRDQAEADVISVLLARLQAIDVQRDADYVTHPDWPEVIAAAQAATELLSEPPRA